MKRWPSPPRYDAFPAVCRAGEFQFAAGQTHLNRCVQSRALFWCKSGSGRFTVDRQSFKLEPNDLYVLPWNRRIEYFANERTPMFTAHVHIVPWMKPGAKWEANVPHERGEPNFDSPDRADLDWPSYEGVVRLKMDSEHTLGRLINYATHWFRHSSRLEDEARELGHLLVRELFRFVHSPTKSDNRLPEELRRLILHIDNCFQRRPTVEQLTRILGRSRSHILTLFQTHLNTSAKSYIVNRQIREARELLLSTTMAISEVGAASGFPDPYHFSKVFRQTTGMSPSDYRQLKSPIPIRSTPSVHRSDPPQSDSD